MKKQTLLTATLCLMATFCLFSQESYTAHTLQLKEGSPVPKRKHGSGTTAPMR